ncbi:hypothetical protein [Pseudomonas sp. OTU2001]|uniref:hypothetical protein n=1 Tax=Pseudomonas sp. OTU2001 TaxID=3043859 RepID=UPI00313E4CD4
MDLNTIFAVLPLIASLISMYLVTRTVKERLHAEKEFIKVIKEQADELIRGKLVIPEIQEHAYRALKLKSTEVSAGEPVILSLESASPELQSRLKALQQLKEAYIASFEFARLDDFNVVVNALEKMPEPDRQQITQTLSRYTDSGRLRYLNTVFNRVARAITSTRRFGFL